jgi:predicted permease
MRNVFADVRYALRAFARDPGFTATAALTLALGIGATTAVYSVVSAVLWSPLPFARPERIAIVWETDVHNGELDGRVSYPDLVDWRAQTRAFARLAASMPLDLNLTESGREPERVSVGAVSHDLFPLLGLRPVLGRVLTPADDREGAPGVVVLSRALWTARYDGDAGVLGRTIQLDGQPHTVVGVLQDGFETLGRARAWVAVTPNLGAFLHERGVHGLTVFGLLRDGQSFETAGAEMAAIAARLARAYPNENVGRGARVQALDEAIVGDVRRELLLLLAAVVAVTLVACANVSGLLLARARARAREIAIRRALGAGARRLAAQFLTETLVLAAGAAAAGIVLAAWATPALVTLAADGLPRTAGVGLHPGVVAFAVGASFVAGALAALAPLRGMIGGRERALPAMSGTSTGRDRLRSALVVGQVALACVLATGAGLLLASLRNARRVDPGFRPDGLLVASLQLPKAAYPPPARTADFSNWPTVQNFYRALLPRLASLPGASSAAVAVNHPLQPGWTSEIQVEGRANPPGKRDEVYIRPVAPGYFRTVGAPLRAGRDFDAGDRLGSADVVVVNDAFARRYFPGRDAVGLAVSFWGKPRRVIGVVADERFRGVTDPAAPAVYPTLLQVPVSSLSLVVRAPAGTDALSLAPALRRALREIDPDVALFDVGTADVLLDKSLGSPRFRAALLGFFGAAALLLSAVGLYGLLAHSVARRTREIGIRTALGARRADVLRLVVGEGLARGGAGLALGLVGAVVASRLLTRLLFGVRPADPAILATVAAVFLAVTVAASLLPARRAARVDPATALRTE